MTTTTKTSKFGGFSAEEIAAMKDHGEELRNTSRRDPNKAREAGEKDILGKLAKMSDSDRAIGERIHAIVTANAPELMPKLWYGMPAYARDGKVVLFFQSAAKFKSRYATLGFSDQAGLDDGEMWPSAYALKSLTPGDEARIGALVKQAAG
ncbi:DUF1801 domain-containing protein [Dactylosporangium salmoneum]|uniref:DUF1801 domain-containing protein n=1 Tax=Dactylosporangium salmoneum TaxID=53361 RepID=A0ABP5SQC4_9ACTN